MAQTKQRQQKRKAREREVRREANMRRNNTPHKDYTLSVLVGERWRPAMTFSTEKEAKAYAASVEDIRKRGDTEIVQGRIIHRPSGRLVVAIEAFQPEAGKTCSAQLENDGAEAM